MSELRRSSFLATLRLLQEEDDINQVTDFFSYEHFYVIYCKFWELDKATSCKYNDKNDRLFINITILKVHLSLFTKTASWNYYSAAEPAIEIDGLFTVCSVQGYSKTGSQSKNPSKLF